MMKTFIPLVIFFSAVTLFSYVYSPPTLAKKSCKPYLDKLHNIQALQRQGHSLKQGQSLRAREDKARDKWWQCERSSSVKVSDKPKGGKNKAKTSTKKTKKKATSKHNKTSKNSTDAGKVTKASANTTKKTAVVNHSSAIVIKSKYQGDKKQAWLKFYHQPIKCQSPKTLSVFAYCNEHRLQQQDEFDKVYRE